MKPMERKVTFQPSGQSVYVLPGTSLMEAAGRAGVILQAPCGGRGTCGKCRVQIAKGDCSPPDDPAPLTPDMVARGFRLACRTRVHGPLVVVVPEESMFERAQQILTSGKATASNLNPAVRKTLFDLTPPGCGDARSDIARLKGALGEVEIPFDLLQRAPDVLRAQGWRGTATVSEGVLLALEAGDTTGSCYGAAFDVGTTTVVGKLCDLTTGRECAVASLINPQVSFGDDVLSRILRVREDPSSLKLLQTAIVEALNALLAALAQQAGVTAEAIFEIVLAGNSTMQQIVCGMNPSALGEVPFVPVFDEALRLPASRMGLRAHPGAQVFVFPQVGGFLGGDTVAGMVAARLDRAERPVLFVDIGTNGEIVLAHDGALWATSTAAGPAFEGARIAQGMRATGGAIEKVLLRDEVLLNVIGNTRPAGLCGTALIDAAADMLRMGLLDETGRIRAPGETPQGVPEGVRRRLEAVNGEIRFVLADADESAGGEAICLWQRDVRELQLATAALRAGTQMLLRRAGLEPSDLGSVLLAGAFGNFIRRSNARRIGLLPAVPCDRIHFIGNASLLGAKLVLLSREERAYASLFRRKTRHVDLSLDAHFQAEFGEAMIFPEGDLDACGDEHGTGA